MDRRLTSQIRKATGPFYKPLYIAYLLLADHNSWRFYPDWLRSWGHSPLTDGMPLLPFEATSWLRSYLQRDMEVFEYGSGGSTVFFAQTVGRVFAVEHDREWHSLVTNTLAERGLINTCCSLCEPQLADFVSSTTGKHDGLVFDEKGYQGLNFAEYV